MKAIKKDIAQSSIPSSLADEKRKATFDSLKALQSYPSGNNDYKTTEVVKALKNIYNNKCAFCEKDLTDTARHVEHYRPKNKDERRVNCCANTSYFWLAFSWDNLLLACGECNGAKGSCFDIQGTRADYQGKYVNYALEQLQGLIKELDETEKPQLVNPEQEEQSFFDKNLSFSIGITGEGNELGEISSKNERLDYTIRVCNLNRDDLVKLRLGIINDLRNTINRRKGAFALRLCSKETYAHDIAMLRGDLLDKIAKDPCFSALYKFIEARFNEFSQTKAT